MKKIKLSIILLYLLWIIAFVLGTTKSTNIVIFTYITLFQFFIPGLVLGASFGLFNRPLTEIILYSFILSYMVYLVATLPTLFFQVKWQFFVGLNIFLYLLVFVIFIIKSYKGLIFKWVKPDVNEIFVIALGIVVLLSFTYINFRSDASYYNNRISSSIQSNYVETGSYNWNLNKDGSMSNIKYCVFHEKFKPFFNFLALPLKYTSFDQRYGWFIFNKIFIFLSIIGVYCLGRGLLNPTYGYLSLLFFMVIVFILGFYYGEGNITRTGLLFAQAAYPRHVSENIFLLAFYLTCVNAFRTQNRNTFLFAGLILLSILSIHYYAFTWAVLNFVMFSVIIFALSLYYTKNVSFEFTKLLKNNMYVAAFSAVYLLCLIIFTDYYHDFIYYKKYFQATYSGYGSAYLANKTFYGQCLTLLNKANILIVISIIFGTPLLILKAKSVTAFVPLFLLSNLLVYLLLKFPLHNLVLEFNAALAGRVDGGVLPFMIVAFIVVCLGKRLNWKTSYMNYTAAVVIVTIFVVFGTNNSFAEKLRYRKNAGHDYLKMTEYFNSIKTPSEGGITVFTNYKTAVDVFAFLNAYVYQYDSKAIWPFTISWYKKDLEELLIYPDKQSEKLNFFVNNNRVDYIVLPTANTPYLTKKMVLNFDRAIKFYNQLKTYKLIYSDKYYYVYKNITLAYR